MFNANDAGPTCACQRDKYGPDTPALLASTSDSAVAPRSAIDPNPASSAARTFQPPSPADDVAPATTAPPRRPRAPRADADATRTGAARRVATTARRSRPRTSSPSPPRATTENDDDDDDDALVDALGVVVARRRGAVDGNVARARVAVAIAIVAIAVVVVAVAVDCVNKHAAEWTRRSGHRRRRWRRRSAASAHCNLPSHHLKHQAAHHASRER
mmetsp:Transcript_3652/g.13177  ORF Transcript_3652/g.13177 Transcript_3652/m.13177 type:complete len:215 (+) Transcript_3652:1247-1891(+)